MDALPDSHEYVVQVTLPKPIGVRLGRGNDGAAYVRVADEAIGNSDERIQVQFIFSLLLQLLFHPSMLQSMGTTLQRSEATSMWAPTLSAVCTRQTPM
jgi:hypothetical protein